MSRRTGPIRAAYGRLVLVALCVPAAALNASITNQPQAAAARARPGRLTPRERDVLALLARGDTNAGIASRLAMRESTVKAHVSRIPTALDVTNRVQAALLARDAGLSP